MQKVLDSVTAGGVPLLYCAVCDTRFPLGEWRKHRYGERHFKLVFRNNPSDNQACVRSLEEEQTRNDGAIADELQDEDRVLPVAGDSCGGAEAQYTLPAEEPDAERPREVPAVGDSCGGTVTQLLFPVEDPTVGPHEEPVISAIFESESSSLDYAEGDEDN